MNFNLFGALDNPYTLGRVTIRGHVYDGRGNAGKCMGEDNFLSEAIDVALVQGSLNVFVAGNHRIFGQNVNASACRAAGFVDAIPCTVNGTNAFILNSDVEPRRATIDGESTMIEIFATVRLRDVLKLENLSMVDVTYNPGDLRRYRPGALPTLVA